MESYFFYWKATSEREKVGEPYIYSLAEHPLMSTLYDGEFTTESVRRALSAISNREIFAPASKKEGRFWNNNMWMLEDLSNAEGMMAPVKVLSVAEFADLDGEIAFVPAHLETLYVDSANKRILINFFKLMTDMTTGQVTIEGKSLDAFVKEAVEQLR